MKNKSKSKISAAKNASFLSEQRYTELFEQAGLDEKEAQIFNVLLRNGEMGAGEIIATTGLKRGDAYNHIYSLLEKGLVEESSKEGWKRFRLEHPSKIEEHIEKRSQELTTAKKELSGAMSAILSIYNLSYHKPGVKVFEGEEGTAQLMQDTLTAKTEILQIIDPLALEKFLHKENERYVKQRMALKVKKRILFPDSLFTREYALKKYPKTANDSLQEIRLVKLDRPNFATSIQIYDNKFALHTLKKGLSIGIIIEDETICEIQRSIFEAIWATAKKIEN